MSDSPRHQSVESSGKTQGPAVKDKECPYCQQKFTSSSLGRHLDLFIKPVNPKAPDGKHDVEAIRRDRSNITRRHPRGSLRGQSGTPAQTPRPAGARRSVAPSDGGNSSTVASPTQRRASLAVNREHTYPFAQPGWQQTGVINNIPFEGSNTRDGNGESHSVRAHSPHQTRDRVVSRQAQKAQFDLKQKLQDAQDTSRAAELALKELLSSWRAAKYVAALIYPLDNLAWLL